MYQDGALRVECLASNERQVGRQLCDVGVGDLEVLLRSRASRALAFDSLQDLHVERVHLDGELLAVRLDG